MKGRNEVRLNEETMIVVVQHYFDTVLFAQGQSPKVTRVGRDSVSETFEIDVDEQEPTVRLNGAQAEGEP